MYDLPPIRNLIGRIILHNLTSIALFYPSILSHYSTFFTSLPSTSSSSTTTSSSTTSSSSSSTTSTTSSTSTITTSPNQCNQFTSQQVDDIIQRVYKRLRNLRKRIEKGNRVVGLLFSGECSFDDYMQLESRQSYIVCFYSIIITAF